MDYRTSHKAWLQEKRLQKIGIPHTSHKSIITQYKSTTPEIKLCEICHQYDNNTIFVHPMGYVKTCSYACYRDSQ